MKTGEAAKLLGVDVSTVRNWIHHPLFEQYFSESARHQHGGTQRILTESDILVLNTIRHRRASGAEWSVIQEFLETGRRVQEFPANAISVDPRLIPIPQAEQAARTLAMVAERDAALAKVNELADKLERVEREKEELRAKLTQEKEVVRQELTQQMEAVRRELLQQIIDLNRQIGRLEGRLEEKE